MHHIPMPKKTCFHLSFKKHLFSLQRYFLTKNTLISSFPLNVINKCYRSENPAQFQPHQRSSLWISILTPILQTQASSHTYVHVGYAYAFKLAIHLIAVIICDINSDKSQLLQIVAYQIFTTTVK